MSDPAVAAICRFTPKYMRFLRAGDGGASPARVMAMQCLAAEAPMAMAELADRISVSKRNVTGLIDAMERDGLVVRAPHPTDRRVKLVDLTEKGWALHREAVAAHHGRIKALLDALAPEERAAFAQALDRVADALDAQKT